MRNEKEGSVIKKTTKGTGDHNRPFGRLLCRRLTEDAAGGHSGPGLIAHGGGGFPGPGPPGCSTVTVTVTGTAVVDHIMMTEVTGPGHVCTVNLAHSGRGIMMWRDSDVRPSGWHSYNDRDGAA